MLFYMANKVHNGFVYCVIVRCMYGLPQLGILPNKLIRERLPKHGYYKMSHTPGLWNMYQDQYPLHL